MKTFFASRFSLLITLSTLATCLDSSAAAFQNGSFEQPILTTPPGVVLPGGSAEISGWITGGPGVVSFVTGPASGTNPFDGNQQIAFNGGNLETGSTLSQTFDTVPGRTYSVSFFVGRAGPGSGEMKLSAAANSATGEPLGWLTAVAPDLPGYGSVNSFRFSAATATSTLTFTDTSTATIAVDLLLDNVSVAPVLQCITAPSGLFSWWPAEGNANDAVGGNPGTITTQFLGQVLFAEGKVGKAFDFRGTNFVEIPPIPLNSFTLEFWLNQRTRGTEPEMGSILVSAEVCGVVDDWGVSILPDGRLRVQVGDAALGFTPSFPTSLSSIPLNRFTHVAVTRNTVDSEIKIYIDGVLDSTHIAPHNRVLGAMEPTCDASIHQNRIGIGNLRRQAVLGGNISAFDGLIDEVSIYNRALAREEVQAIVNAGAAGKCLPPPLPPPSGSLVSNGGFEIPNGVNPYQVFGAGSNLPGWTVESGTVEIVGPYWQAPEGSQSLDLNGIFEDIGTIYQDVPTVIGQAYKVRFAYAGNPECGATVAIKSFKVFWNDGEIASLQFDTTGKSVADMGWQYYEGVVTASSASSRLKFKSTSPSFCGAALDDISLTPVRQPPVGPFVNGSFESPALAPGSGVDLAAGTGGLTGWTVGSSGLVSFRNGPAYGVSPVDGVQEIGFNGADTPPGGLISQTFSTTVGQDYTVRFNVGRQGPGSGTMRLHVEVTSPDGEVLGSLDAEAPASSGYGPAQSLTFTATADSSTLTFRDTSTATVAVDVMLDNVTVTPFSQCFPAPVGLVSWWKGEGDGTDLVGGNNGWLNGVTFSAGMVGGAFNFDGTDSRLNFGNTVGNFGTNDFTIEFWIRTSSTRLESVMEKWPVCGVSSMWNIRIGQPVTNDGHLNTEMFSDALGNGHAVLVSGRAINDGIFHHVALVRLGTSVAYYIDGAVDVSTSSVGGVTEINNTADFAVGRSVCVGIDGTSPFTGQMDEISVYNRALSASEIAAIYQAGTAGKCAPVAPHGIAIAHWKFDETSGNVAHDSGGSFNGTLSPGGASFVTGGVSGGALSLSKANNGFVNMGNALGLEDTDFSVVAWVKMTAGDTSNTVILSKHAAYSRNGYLLGVNRLEVFRDNKASFVEGGSGVAAYTIDETPISTTDVNDGNWHQVVAVYHAGGVRSIYVDGAPAEDSKPSQPFNQNSVAFLIGGANYEGVPTGVFTGLIDDVQIYNYALASSNVDFLFQNPGQEIAPHELPSGNWRLDTLVTPGGTITRDPDLALYTNGAIVTLTAVPNAGYVFTGWTGDVTATNNPVTITIDANKSVTARFREIPARVLAVVNPEPGQEGSRISVPIVLVSQGDVGGISFLLHYDPAFLRDPELSWESAAPSALYQVNSDTPGQVFATFALPALAVPAGTQTVANVSFQARSVPETLTTGLGLEILDASEPTGDPITSGSLGQGGQARILVRTVLGDNNANNRIDIGDATIIQRLLTGLDPVRSWDVTGNDLNANAKLDSGDVIKVLRAVVGLDPQPSPPGALTGASTKIGGRSANAGPASESATLALDRQRAQPDDQVTVQVRIQGVTTPLSGVSFALGYPTNALRLVNAQSERTGAIVPSASAVTVWNVQPAQTDFTLQSGAILAAVSSPTAWATNNGVLAEFVFQVQPGETAHYQWPIRLTKLELSDDGYEVRSLADATAYFIGRDPIPPSLIATSAAFTPDGLSLSLAVDAGLSYTIEVSTDLNTWKTLANLDATSGILSFVDPGAKNSDRRFYRAVQQAVVKSQPR